MRGGLPAGAGLGWRPATAWLIDQRPGLWLTEVIAENVDPARPPAALATLRARGTVVIPHGVSLGLGGIEPPDPARLRRLRDVARALGAPVVSEHLALVRAGGVEAGHLLPVPRTRAHLARVVDHVRRAQDAVGVPLVIENVAAPLRWPDDELPEAAFVAEVIERADVGLLLDVANLHANLVNGTCEAASADAYLDRLPLARIAYCHAAGGARHGAWWRDTHAHPVGDGALEVLAAVVRRVGAGRLPVLLERDHRWGTRAGLEAELDAIARVVAGDAAPAADGEVATHRPRRAPLPPVAGPSDPAALVAALVADGPPPPGFDPDELAEARAILADKRARVAAHAPAAGGATPWWRRWARPRPPGVTRGSSAA